MSSSGKGRTSSRSSKKPVPEPESSDDEPIEQRPVSVFEEFEIINRIRTTPASHIIKEGKFQSDIEETKLSNKLKELGITEKPEIHVGGVIIRDGKKVATGDTIESRVRVDRTPLAENPRIELPSSISSMIRPDLVIKRKKSKKDEEESSSSQLNIKDIDIERVAPNNNLKVGGKEPYNIHELKAIAKLLDPTINTNVNRKNLVENIKIVYSRKTGTSKSSK